MKNPVSLLLFSVGIALLSSCSHGPIYTSEWQAQPLPFDQAPLDWAHPLDYYDKETKLNFTVSNDSNTLYFQIEAFDEESQQQIVYGGLNIWLDTTGGDSKKTGLLFPAPGTVERSQGGTASAQNGVFDPIADIREHFARSSAQMDVIGFYMPIAGRLPLRNAFGLQARIDWDTVNNVLHYIAAIPFATFYSSEVNHPGASQPFGIGFTLNGIPPSRSPSGAGMGRRGGSSGSGPSGSGPSGGEPSGAAPGIGPSGGMPGGFSGGSMGHRGHRGGGSKEPDGARAQATYLWFRVQLAHGR